MTSLNQPDNGMEKKFSDFVRSAIVKMAKQHELNPKALTNCLSFIFADDRQYGEEIRKIDPAASYTDDGRSRGYGKIIFKDGKTSIIINLRILNNLIQSGYKDITCKHVIYHELGHWVNYILNPELQPEEQPFGKVPLWDGSRYLCSVMVDEYMANNHIAFLFSEDDCMEILRFNTLYTDIENIYTNIFDPFDLFNRFWNGPKAIFRNLLEHIPFFQATGGFKETAVLEIMDIKSIIALLNKPERQFDIIYRHLVRTFNIIVADYNSDNPPILQKRIQ